GGRLGRGLTGDAGPGEVAPGPPLSGRGRATLVVAVITVGLWLTADLHGIRPAGVALLSSAALTALGLLGRDDVDAIDWNVLILMWGGLALGDAMASLGVLEQIGNLDLSPLPGGNWGLVLAAAVVAAGLSTFMSNTAAANLLLPVALALGVAAGPVTMAMVVALACSLAMAMPVSTPPNAIVFATGRVSAPMMVRRGSVMTLVGLAVLVATVPWLVIWLVGA
ncbi:MAG: SLC13 family permease, partial [Phycisphaeraceae bacterium]|nr:SLC13 family permease [Phycisphaeraceae bacterium]